VDASSGWSVSSAAASTLGEPPVRVLVPEPQHQ
jgi:hypothetical protein